MKARLIIGGTLAATIAVLQSVGVIAIPASVGWVAFGVAVVAGIAVIVILQKASSNL